MKPSNFESYLKSTNVRVSNRKIRILGSVFKFAQTVYPKGLKDFVRKKFFTPSVRQLNKAQEEWLNVSESHDILTGDGVVKAWKAGEGPAVLFAHGWNGRGGQFYHFFQPFLGAGYSVIFYDAPAHGESDGDMTNYLEMTASLEPIFMHNFGQPIVGVVAHSMGSSVIINHMADNPKNIPLVFIAPALKLLELLFNSFRQHGVPERTFLGLVREVEEKYQIPLDTRNPIDLIRQLTNEILIVHDPGDKTTPIDSSIKASQMMDNVTLVKTLGLGHNVLLKDAEVIEKVVGFIDQKFGNSRKLKRQKVASN
jgi:pimeloyl-ACP methyl ester carboxylesterase